jgi:hypothetical protein
MNNHLLIIHKIVLYVKTPSIVKLFFDLYNYRSLIQSSDYHFDQLYALYGYNGWVKIVNLRSFQAKLRLKIPFFYGPSDPIDFAAKNGHLDILIWFHQNQTNPILANCYKTCDKRAIGEAALYNHFEVVKWLHQNYHDYCDIFGALDYATIKGHFEIVKWLYLNEPSLAQSYNAIDRATEYNNLPMVKWLHENYYDLYAQEANIDRAFYWAVHDGYVDIIEYLYLHFSNILKKTVNNILQTTYVKANIYQILKKYQNAFK